MIRHAVVNATAVLPDRVLHDATVVAEDGVIVEVGDAVRRPPDALDARGALLLPGLVDVHSDGLERELRPRPGVEVSPEFAVTSYEGKVRAAGVTTMFHGIGYQTNERKERSLEQARTLEDALVRRSWADDCLVDHRLLRRLDVRDPQALKALRSALEGGHLPDDALPLVSFEDHTPGQGQFADARYFRAQMQTAGLSADEAEARFSGLVAERESLKWHVDVALEWLSGQARAGHLRLLAHDPVTGEEIHSAVRGGVAVAEFPTSREAAETARAQGLPVVMGAPNVLRGGSHSGNASATELIHAGLVDALASDYMPSTLLAAVLTLADRSVVNLPEAVALVTTGAARVAGLSDRGAIAVGRRSDLTVVTRWAGWPTVRAVLSAQAQQDGSGERRCDTTVAV
jgi:alpha-D-ribose 1-methylphosphonate 5-triphosphate diphosphatase